MEHPVYSSILPSSFCILITSVPLVLQLFISTYSNLLIARSVRFFFCFDNFYIAIFRSFLLTCPAFFSEHDVSTLCVPLGCTLSRDCVFFSPLVSFLFLRGRLLCRGQAVLAPWNESAGSDGRVRMYRVPGKAAFLRHEKEKERAGSC